MKRKFQWHVNFIEQYRKLSITRKLPLLFIALITLVLLISYCAVWTFTYRKSRANYEEILNSHVGNIVVQTQAILDSIDGCLSLTAPNEYVQTALMNGNTATDIELYQYKTDLRNYMDTIVTSNQNVALIEVEDLYGNSYFSSLWDESTFPEYQNIEMPTEDITQGEKIVQDIQFSLPDGQAIYTSIVVRYKVYDKGSGTHIGYLNILLNDTSLSENLESFLLHDDDIAMIIAQDNTLVLATQSDDVIQELFEDSLFITQEEGQTVYTEGYVWKVQQIDAQWSVQYAMSLSDLKSELNFAAVLFIGLFLVTATVGLTLMYRTTKSFLSPLLALGNAMTQSTGQDMQYVYVKNQDEIGLLVYHYNCMVDNNKALLSQVIEEQKERQYYEYLSVQAQINPHFLYNTLETICGLADAKKNDLIIEIVNALADFYRTTLNDGQSTLTLRQELAVTERYLEILQIRYQGGFSYKIDVDPALLDCACLKLLLQPLVENTIQHGFSCQDPSQTIHITGALVNGKIHLIVSDNGCGISQVQMKNFEQGLEKTEKIGHFGIYSVQKRIQSYFGSSYGIELSHATPHGLCVTLVLPFKTDFK